MKLKMREIARLGSGRPGYPCLLADSRNLVLQLGPDRRHDLRYYSSWDSLIRGLIEHLRLRTLGKETLIKGLHALLRAEKDFMRDCRKIVEQAAKVAARNMDLIDSDARKRRGKGWVRVARSQTGTGH